MKKPFIVANVRDILDQYDKEEISFSKMVEMLNDVAEKFYVVPESERTCVNCFYGVTLFGKEPCSSCFGYAKWRSE